MLTQVVGVVDERNDVLKTCLSDFTSSGIFVQNVSGEHVLLLQKQVGISGRYLQCHGILVECG